MVRWKSCKRLQSLLRGGLMMACGCTILRIICRTFYWKFWIILVWIDRMSKYPNHYEWMDNYAWEEDMDHIEVMTMGFLPEQTDVMKAFCKCFGLSFSFETIYMNG